MDMNATSNSQYKTVNTDGTDTWNSRDIVISNWTVTCGDVSISYNNRTTVLISTLRTVSQLKAIAPMSLSVTLSATNQAECVSAASAKMPEPQTSSTTLYSTI